MIDYHDTNGDFSRRDITIHGVLRTGKHLYLEAYCNTRRAPRRFRVDRIDGFITDDGEVISADDFLRDIAETTAPIGAVDASTSDRAPRQRSPTGGGFARVLKVLWRLFLAATALIAIAATFEVSKTDGITAGILVLVIVLTPLLVIDRAFAAIGRRMRRN